MAKRRPHSSIEKKHEKTVFFLQSKRIYSLTVRVDSLLGASQDPWGNEPSQRHTIGVMPLRAASDSHLRVDVPTYTGLKGLCP